MSLSFNDWSLHEDAKGQKLNLRRVAHCSHKWKFSRRVNYEGNSHTQHVIGSGHDVFACSKCRWRRQVSDEREYYTLPLHGLSEKGGYVDGQKVRDRNI